METQIQPLLISKRDAARLLGLSVRTIENFLGAKKLTARRIGRRTLVTFGSVRALASHDSPSPSPTAQHANRGGTDRGDDGR